MPIDMPRVSLSGIPAEEIESARDLQGALNDMRNFVRSFESALELFKFSQYQTYEYMQRMPKGPHTPDPRAERSFRVIASWGHLAARDGALSIYHFAMALEGVRDMRACPALRSKVDHKAIRIAGKLFETRFPHFRNIRHAVAHAGELTNTSANRKANAFKGSMKEYGLNISNATGVIIRDHLYNDRYVNTFLGKVLAYAINDQSLTWLVDITQRIYAAFPKAGNRATRDVSQ